MIYKLEAFIMKNLAIKKPKLKLVKVRIKKALSEANKSKCH